MRHLIRVSGICIILSLSGPAREEHTLLDKSCLFIMFHQASCLCHSSSARSSSLPIQIVLLSLLPRLGADSGLHALPVDDGSGLEDAELTGKSSPLLLEMGY